MRARPLFGFFVLLSLGLSPPVWAQPSPAQIEAAKKTAAESADKALDAFDAGKYADAIAGFTAADKAFHAPKFQLYIARAQVKLGQLLLAKATYEAIVQEKIPVFAPPEFFTAQATAKKELAELTPRIPTLQIQAKGGIERASLDGKDVPLGTAFAVDPGEHTLDGTGPGDKTAHLVITTLEKEAKMAVLEATFVPPAPTSAPTAESKGEGGVLSTIPAPAFAAYGAGAVGLVVGGIFGGLTVAKKGDYDALRETSPLDPKKVNEAAAEGRTFSLVADVGFITAIAGVAVGTLVWRLMPKKTAQPQGALNTPTNILIAPRVGGISIGGSF